MVALKHTIMPTYKSVNATFVWCDSVKDHEITLGLRLGPYPTKNILTKDSKRKLTLRSQEDGGLHFTDTV